MITEDLTIRYNYDYFMYGQFMKFVRRGARRVESGAHSRDLGHVAFVNPDGEVVLVVANVTQSDVAVAVSQGTLRFRKSLPPLSTATFTWSTR